MGWGQEILGKIRTPANFETRIPLVGGSTDLNLIGRGSSTLSVCPTKGRGNLKIQNGWIPLKICTGTKSCTGNLKTSVPTTSFVVETQQQQKVCTMLIVTTVIYLDAKLAAITYYPTLSLIAISFNSHLNSQRSSMTTTKVYMIFPIVTRERQFSAEFAQLTTCIYTDDKHMKLIYVDNKHMSLIYIDDKQMSLDIPN